MDRFSIDIDLYERLVAVRKVLGLPISDYLDRAKESLLTDDFFIIKGNVVNIKRGRTCLN